MWRRHVSAVAVLAAVSAAACGGGDSRNAPVPPPAQSPEEHRAAVQAWRDKHGVDYRRDYVSIAGLHPLRAGANTAGSRAGQHVVLPASVPPTIGQFVVNGRTVRFEPERGVDVLLKGQPVTSPITLNDDTTATPDELIIGSVRLVVHPSGDLIAIRVRDPQGPLALGFLGFSWFDFDPRFRVVGRFIADAEPRRLKVQNTYGELDEFATEGVVEFKWEGQTQRLRPFTTRPKRLYFVFRDASAGQETYEAARFLYADLADDGSTVLDFNMAYNPPCAFNQYTTCPIPLPENRLPVKVLAGEKKYPSKCRF